MVGPVELIVAGFNEEEKAAEVLKEIRKLQKDDVIFLINAAVLKKDQNGKISIKETEDVSTGKGALFGALAGGLVGLLGGPVGVVIGAAAGAATGGVAANKIDMGFPNDTLEELKDTLKPGNSAILALIQHQWVDRIVEELEKYNAALFRQSLKEELSSQLTDGEQKASDKPEKTE